MASLLAGAGYASGAEAACEPIREFRHLVVEALKTKEEFRSSVSTAYSDRILSSFWGSDKYDIAHWYVHSNPPHIFQMGRRTARIIYGNHTSWHHLVAVFGSDGFWSTQEGWQMLGLKGGMNDCIIL
jgi:hypothetical protein